MSTKDWFFKNLAEQILKLKPEYEIKPAEKKRVPIAVFESNDLWIEKQKEADEKEKVDRGFREAV